MSRNFIVLDTEGVSDGTPARNLGANALFYDCGFIVANREGDVLKEFSFVNSDVFMQNDLMQTAYYANKLPQYYNGIAAGEWKVASTLDTWLTFKDAARRYGVRDVWAYNAGYDRQSLNYTINKMSNGFRPFFLPYGMKFRDIWDYAGQTVTNTKKYVKWCFENGLISEKGNPTTTADAVGKYLRGDMEYKEQHTALADCRDELAILLACLRRKQKAVIYDKKGNYMSGQGWRNASAIAKTLAA